MTEYDRASEATRNMALRIAQLFNQNDLDETGDSTWPEWSFGFTDTDGHTYSVAVTSTDEHHA